jgi:beta-galactosidase
LKTIELNDQWLFTKENSQAYVHEEIGSAEVVSLPHSWNGVDGQSGKGLFKGMCWYQRRLNISEEELNKAIFLEIGAAAIVSEVYINGQLAGDSKCAYAMYRVFLNAFLKAGENIISIRVDNSLQEDIYPLMADFSFYGGLYREVKLIIAEDLHFDLLDNSRVGIYLTQKCIESNTFELNVKASVVNELSEIQDGLLKIELFDKDEKVVLSQQTPIEVSKLLMVQLKEEVKDVTLWQGIENPYLYTLKAQLICEGKVYDERAIEIGFRTIEITADRGLLLNGKAIKLNGVSRHQDFAAVGNALTKEHMELDMSLIKEIGANSIRLAHYQHDDYFYSLCDREGMLVWAEIPFISVPTTVDEQNQNAKDQLERLIKQAYNHSSIYCWGVQNEITIAVENESIYAKVKELESIAKTLDPSRFSTQANIYSVADESPLNELTDIVGYNLYYGWYYKDLEDLAKRLDGFHKTRPNIPVLISEYGVDTNPKLHSYNPTVKDYTEEYQLLFHDNAIKTINERPFILGGYQWNMFDFGSDLRNEGGESGKNLKGLVTIDRKIKKDAFYLYKAYWSKDPFVHLAGKRFVNRHEALNDIVVLTNLEHVKLFIRDEMIGEINNSEPIKSFKAVKLNPGENLLKVEGYANNGDLFKDQMLLNHVQEMDKSYILVKAEDNTHVVNWFEKFDLTNVQEVTLKEGYYSTFDTIKDLYANEQAKAVFKKYFGDSAEHPKFKSMMALTSIDGMSKISRFNIPKELLTVINRELNSIPKNS